MRPGRFHHGTAAVESAQGDAHLPVDQEHGQSGRIGGFQRGAQLGARFHAQLVGQPLLVGGERQIGGDQAHLALAHHLQQVHARQGVGVAQGGMAAGAQLHRHGVEAAAGDQLAHGRLAGAGDVGGAEQGDRGGAQGDFPQRLIGGDFGQVHGYL